ncbi:MAG: zinc ribbon domain-containing protein [Lachnospiraceae bacterium]|nr:zinc ribbon domain-containing protein [Lachnospiraceae bacterium]
MRCKSCGAEIPEGMSVCLECGAIPDNTIFSQETGTEWKDKQQTPTNVVTHGWKKPFGANPLVWFARFQGLQLIIYVFQFVIALMLFYYLNHLERLFTKSGANFYDFLEKSANTIKWVEIVIMVLSLVALFAMSSYGEGFLHAGLIATVLVVEQFLTNDMTNVYYRLLAEGAALILEILYAVVLFKQLSSFTRPLNRDISERWDRLLTLWIYAYLAAGALGVYMALAVKTIKGMELCIAAAYLLVFAIGLPVYMHLKRTSELIR